MKSLLSVLTLISVFTFAQNKPGAPLSIKKATSPVTIDGVLDEPVWAEAQIARDFHLVFPVDTAQAPYQTEVKLTFDEHNIYLAFICHDDEKPYVVQSLKRDFDFDNNDNMTVLFGPYNDKQNGFYFTITPYNVQGEGTVSAGGSNDGSYSSSWDNKWYSKTTRHSDKWIAEIAIPFKSIRYKSVAEWNINFLRWDRKHSLASTWVAVPIQYSAGSYAYSGQLVWQDPAPKPALNVSVIPYVAGITAQDREVSPINKTNDLQFGVDAKVAVTPSLNLDLTVNPDFSQVDVDQQVINLTRFEFQFPERRSFFLENSDLFANAGFPPARLFFSRRIGIASDTSGNLQRVPISFGARLSGSINKNWRIGVMNMQTKEKLSIGLPKQNYAVATVMRNFGHQSNISFTYVDKSSLGLNQEDTSKYFHESVRKYHTINGINTAEFSKYSRALGVDLELLSKDNKWYSSSFYTLSLNPFINGNNHSFGTFGQFANREINMNVGGYLVGENYNSEAGFVRSYGVYPGVVSGFMSFTYNLYPKGDAIAIMGPQSDLSIGYTPTGTLTDQNYSAGYNINFKNSSSFQVNWLYNYTRLTNTFNFIDGDKYINFVEGEVYDWHAFNARYQSNLRKLFNFNTSLTYGGFYNGTNFNVTGQLNYRYQPYGSLGIRFDYNDLRLAEGYGKEKLFIIGPRLDITFTNQLFFTTFVQYNNLLDNMALNTRLQWRYKPASDFFIVYTENYLPENFASKNRALVFKFTYWLNI